MKLNVFKGLVFALIVLVFSMGTVMAQDTTWIEIRYQDPDVWAHDQNTSSKIEIYAYSTQNVASVSVGFAMNRRIVSIDTAYLSPILQGAQAPNVVFVNDSIFVTNDTLSFAFFGALQITGGTIFSAGDTTFIGTCEFSFIEDSLDIDPLNPNDFWADDSVLFWFDSTFIPPGGDFIFTAEDGSSIIPNMFSNDSVWLKRFVDVSEIRPNVVPKTFELSQNYPNPFNPSTQIEFAVPSKSHVELVIYNALGQRVRELVNEDLDAGWKSVTWDGTDNTGNSVASGIYLYRIEAGDFAQSKKMILMK